MFENIISQDAAAQLRDDIQSNHLAPSMLFYGPAASGKGSAALELARVLSCENSAAWNCSCPACVRHRYLSHSDLVMLGPRSFSAEIAAARAAYLRDPGASATKLLFIRSLRKLTARFSPVLREDDAKLGKLNPLLLAVEEGLAEFESAAVAVDNAGSEPGADNGGMADIEKFCDSLLKNAVKLESEGLGEFIPIAQIRKAAYWSRLAPSGKQKTLIIENADRMQEGARNSLLKLLEEPPATINIVLTAKRREAIMPTLLSRLRPYRFLKRGAEKESEVIRRVFRDTADSADSGGLARYLDSFLPQPDDKLRALAAFFVTSLARAAVLKLKQDGAAWIPAELTALGAYCAPFAEAAGFPKSHSSGEVCALILAESADFEGRSFSRFLRFCLDFVSAALQKNGAYPHSIAYNDIWRKNTAQADMAAGVWNQNPALALEAFFYGLRSSMIDTGLRAEAS